LRTKEERKVSEQPRRGGLECAAKGQNVQHCFALRLQRQVQSCKAAQEQFNFGGADREEEIPGQGRKGRRDESVTTRDTLSVFEDAWSDFLDECEMRHMKAGNIDVHVLNS
jgi:hypothetical protein